MSETKNFFDLPASEQESLLNGLKSSKKTERKSEQTRSAKTYAIAGRGRKQCPKCNAYVGVRTEFCNCGNEFAINKSVPKERQSHSTTMAIVDDERVTAFLRGIQRQKGDRIIYAPAGGSPIALYGTTKHDVFRWCDDVMDQGEAKRFVYTPQALISFAREGYVDYTEEYKEVVKLIWEYAENVSLPEESE